jgi:hypothetical protein
VPKVRLAMLVVFGMFTTASAGSLKEAFGAGVLGIPWGTSLTGVLGVYPQGDNTLASSEGCRAYWVKDGQAFLGVPRELNGVLFGFDKLNHFVVAEVAFAFERKEELRGTLISLLGVPTARSLPNGATQYGWRSLDGFGASVTEFGDGAQRIVWLTIGGPGYAPTRQCW